MVVDPASVLSAVAAVVAGRGTGDNASDGRPAPAAQTGRRT